ncbi:hypothetical protein ACLB2K_045409 [Fragaria x ananassa]
MSISPRRYMQLNNEVELSGLEMAIATVVTIAGILKNNGLDVEKKIITKTRHEGRCRLKYCLESWTTEEANEYEDDES